MRVHCTYVLVLCLLLPLLASAEMLSIAHRGNSVVAPENTVAAFTAALEHSDMVELDVRVSNEGCW